MERAIAALTCLKKRILQEALVPIGVALWAKRINCFPEAQTHSKRASQWIRST